MSITPLLHTVGTAAVHYFPLLGKYTLLSIANESLYNAHMTYDRGKTGKKSRQYLALAALTASCALLHVPYLAGSATAAALIYSVGHPTKGYRQLWGYEKILNIGRYAVTQPVKIGIQSVIELGKIGMRSVIELSRVGIDSIRQLAFNILYPTNECIIRPLSNYIIEPLWNRAISPAISKISTCILASIGKI